MNQRTALEQLAASHGVETSYYDIQGRQQVASDDALVGILECLGETTAGKDPAALARARHADAAERLVEPVLVSWDGVSGVVARVRRNDAATRIDVVVTTEDGGTVETTQAVDDARVLRRLDVAGREYADVEVRLPHELPVGYHRVALRLGKRAAEAALWVAPPRAFTSSAPPGWGVFTPAYALRSERNAGVGDLADLSALARFVGERGGTTVATLPLLPTFLDGPYDPSPYAPISRLFWNEIYVAVDRIPGLEKAPRAAELLRNAEYRATSVELRASRSVEYQSVVTHKRRVLAELAAAAHADPAERRRLEAFVAANPRVADYARFRAAVERQRRPFTQWPERMRSRIEDQDVDASSLQYHVYCQAVAEAQLAELCKEASTLGVGLYMDLPVGASATGYDAYRFADELVPDCSTGAPPDTLFEGGQSWGFSPPHPTRGSLRGHSYFVASLRHQMRHASMLRIDHVMGLHRLFCIPNGLPATAGVYVRQPSDELYAAVCIESQRSGTVVVGEDLGTVPDEIRARMARHRIGRLYVMQYEPIPERGRSPVVPDGAVASINTHDMPTFAGYLQGRDLETRVELGLLDEAGVARERAERAEQRDRIESWLESRQLLQRPSSDEELLHAELRCLAKTSAALALVSLDDVLGETDPQNVPGTGIERPNWRRKLRRPLEEIVASPEIHYTLGLLHRERREPGRDDSVMQTLRSRPSTWLSDMDLHLFNEGTHRQIQQRLGAHPGTLDGVSGTFFAVWAPNARSVHVVGDFNGWTTLDAPLHARGDSGVWEAFVAGVGPGDLYKYRVVSRDGHAVEKADPFASRAETPPRTASMVWQPKYDFRDSEWMESRARRNAIDAPCSIYEVHLGSFRRAADGALLGYRDLAPLLVEHVQRLGFTHVELMPVMEHPFYGSWGYQLTGYFAATGRYGPPEDLMYLVDQLHQANIGVIFDWVPGHFPTDAHGLGGFDGTHLFEHADPRRGFHPDWKSHIFNYGRHEVRSFLTSSALHWLGRFHGDGLRVDGVASMLYLDYSRSEGEWIPNEYGGRENLEAISFLRWLNESVYAEFPDVQMTAEESTAWPMVSRPTYLGGLGFGTKWDLGWMHDTLDYFSKDPIYRKYHHNRLTFRGVYAWHENFVLPLSHDEVVHGKGSLLSRMPGDDWQRFANLRLLYAYQWASPGHKLLFMGGDLATWREWSHERPLELDLLQWERHAGVSRLVAELNRVYRSEGALHELDQRPEGFVWVDADNAADSVLAFERRARDGSRVLCVFNFTPVARRGYRVGVQTEGFWRELVNTNAGEFGGTGEGNFGGRRTDPVRAHGRPCSLELNLPPLAAVFFRSPA